MVNHKYFVVWAFANCKFIVHMTEICSDFHAAEPETAVSLKPLVTF